jgi:hypothetical protein
MMLGRMVCRRLLLPLFAVSGMSLSSRCVADVAPVVSTKTAFLSSIDPKNPNSQHTGNPTLRRVQMPDSFRSDPEFPNLKAFDIIIICQQFFSLTFGFYFSSSSPVRVEKNSQSSATPSFGILGQA